MNSLTNSVTNIWSNYFNRREIHKLSPMKGNFQINDRVHVVLGHGAQPQFGALDTSGHFGRVHFTDFEQFPKTPPKQFVFLVDPFGLQSLVHGVPQLLSVDILLGLGFLALLRWGCL